MKPDEPTSKERVEHMLRAIDLIQKFIESNSLESFLKDEKTISACLYQYAIIGEAIFRIESTILEKYKYPWHKVKSFRNFILHEYHGIEMRVVYDTSTEVLPGLKEIIQKILQQEF